ncbi:hypothetical protein E2562_035496 [Oryza meyeriana var. granulata]|uniref:Uncharacterized protein n=1 Tax=Oryza meyeriana var. granulata TaxID=110450 RepID=A0A6G1ESM8_9ORYZ|nr:hypothetical protein E2562_035496 [Oryza meyeriana var. granulata]
MPPNACLFSPVLLPCAGLLQPSFPLVPPMEMSSLVVDAVFFDNAESSHSFVLFGFLAVPPPSPCSSCPLPFFLL